MYGVCSERQKQLQMATQRQQFRIHLTTYSTTYMPKPIGCRIIGLEIEDFTKATKMNSIMN